MPRRLLAFVICLVGALLPHRARVLYSEALGWIAQVFHAAVRSIIQHILKEAGARAEGTGEGTGGDGEAKRRDED